MFLTEHNPAMVKPKDKKLSFPDLLPYAFMAAPGVVALKDGCLMAAVKYTGHDLRSSSLEELTRLNEHVNEVLARFDTSVMLHIDLVRHPSIDHPLGKFPDPTTQLIEVERYQRYSAGEHSETSTYLTLTWKPPTERQSWLSSLFQREPGRPAQERWRGQVEQFETMITELAQLLSNHLLTVERLDDAALLSHAESCIIGERVHVRAPGAHDLDLDHYIGRHLFVAGFKPSIDGRHIRVVVPWGFPLETTAELTTALCELPYPYRWSIRFIPLDPMEGARALGTIRRNWFQRKYGGKEFLANAASSQSEPEKVNAHALKMTADADIAIAEAHEAHVRFGYLSMAIVVTHEDKARADEIAEDVRKHLARMRIAAHIETINAVDAYLGTLPGDGYHNVRRPILSTMNLADMMPTTSVWAGLRTNPCPMYPPNTPPLITASTTGWTPFRLNLHYGDVAHTMIVGPTGAGKSTLLALILAQFRRVPNAQVFWFDKGFSSYALTKAVGGTHWNLGEDDLAAAPLIAIDESMEFEWALGFVERLARLNDAPVGPAQRRLLTEALRQLTHQPPERRTISNLRTSVQDIELRNALAPYCLPDPRAKYLDAAEDVALGSDWITFEMEHLTGMNDLTVLPMLDYLFHRIDRRLDGRPTLIALDELASYMTNPAFAATILDWVLTLRKRNAGVILSTPTIAGLVQSKHFNTLIESCPTKIFLPNPEAKAAAADIYALFGLTEQQREVIAAAAPKRDYYYTSPLGKRLFDLTVDEATRAFVGAGSRDDIETIRQLSAEYGKWWPEFWLRRRGVNDWADYWRRLAEDFNYGRAA